MRIIQLTDLHIDKIGEDTHGIDIRKNFQEGLSQARSHHPDLLVISGDLCLRQPNPSIYQWINQQLKDFPVPYELMIGNHDNLDMMRSAFPLLEKDIKANNRLYFARNFNGENVIFLDSGVGTIDAAQLQWLQQQLTQDPPPKTIFIHHPPFLAGVPFMDNNHALKNREDIQKVLLHHPKPISIFTGHYHVEKSLRLQNIDQNITPSTFYQLHGKEPNFKVHSKKRGYRMIDLSKEGVSSMVFYY